MKPSEQIEFLEDCKRNAVNLMGSQQFDAILATLRQLQEVQKGMPEEPERFSLKKFENGKSRLAACDDGDWVQATDYDALRARIAREVSTSDRDRDWILAIGHALGLDSGLHVPIVPEIEPFKKLFAEIAAREVVDSGRAPDGVVAVPRSLLEKWELYLSQGDMTPRWEIHNLLNGVAAVEKKP